jgi:hypothetical protein
MSTVQIKRNTVERAEPLDDFGIAKKAMSSNKFVRRPIGRIDRDIIPRKGTCPKKYTPLRLVNGINRYFAKCEKNDDIPSIKGMMIALKLYPNHFYKMIKDQEFTEILEWSRMMVKNWAELDVYNTPGQAAGKIAYMKNIHDWTDRLQTKNETEVKQVMSTEQATSLLEEFAPLLLELMQDQNVVEQMGNVQEAEIVEEK